ncbi:myosin heavy chain-like protein isoform X1 [Wolffia australiana]
MYSQQVRRSRWSRFTMLFMGFVFLLSPIWSLPDSTSSPVTADGYSELEQLQQMISRLELLLQKNVEDLKSRLNHQEKYMKNKEMSSKGHVSPDSHHPTKSRCASSSAEEKANCLEEIQKLWSETRKNKFDIQNLESKAYDGEKKLNYVSSQVQKMKDIITEQWIQIRQLEQALLTLKIRLSRAEAKSNPTFMSVLRQYNLPNKVISRTESLLFRINSKLRGYPSRLFQVIKTRHHELQGWVRCAMKKNGITASLAHQEIVFILASALLVFPFWAAYFICSSSS